MIKTLLIIFLVLIEGQYFSQDSTKSKPYIYQGIDKSECKKIIKERVRYMTGTWNFVRADFRDTNLRIPIADHSLILTGSKFQVTNNSKSTPIQSGKIKITKDVTEVFEYCYPLIWFGNPNKCFPDDWEHHPNEAHELDTYYMYYLIIKCDKDSLILYSPIGESYKLKKFDQVIKRYVKQK